MFWCDQLLKKVNLHIPHIINDSKTPSGRAHVGALRGVIIHDVVFKILRENGIAARYLYGVDDYDPLDELPYGKDEHFVNYLGTPLCQVPPPPNSQASDMADYYINEFFQVFDYLGVKVEKYRMRDIYRSGQFDEAIHMILENASLVREVYKKVSQSERAAHWYPFQVICEQCGRIGTTEVSHYDGQEVTYTCRPDLVKWAKGCGYQGKMSPFSGNGKLPWKLEWVAKWKMLGISIEGAGKDHSTKGGSRDVATQCLRHIFKQSPPLNIPYEFFLVGGAKMSSSKGIGAAAKEMADFLPPEILRFLMIRPQPHKPINFPVDEENIVKLFNDFDRYQQLSYQSSEATEEAKRVYQLSEIQAEAPYFNANIQLLEALVQLPHLDTVQEVEKRKGSSLNTVELRHLQRRCDAIRYWLAHYAAEEEKLQLQAQLPERAWHLTVVQKAFLQNLAEVLPFVAWEEEGLQATIFTMARLTPIAQPAAFQAIYRVLFDRESGPKAGNLLGFLAREFVVARFLALAFDKVEFWQATALSKVEFETWWKQQVVQKVWADCEEENGKVVLEIWVKVEDGKVYLQRVWFESIVAAKNYLNQLS